MQNDLALWLWQLIGDDPDAGERAAKQIERLYFELNADGEDRFATEIRAALAAPDFGTRLFVERLMEWIEAAQTRRMQVYTEDRDRQNALVASLEGQLKHARRTGVRKELKAHLSEALRFDPERPAEKLQSQWLSRQVQASMVFSCLRDELLLAPEALRAWIGGDGDRKRRLNEALKQLGGAARQFTPDLLAALDRAEMYRFEFVGALASLARDDADTIRALIERVQLSPGKGAVNPLQVLRSIGPRVAEVAPDVFEILFAALDAKESRNAAIRAMGKIGAGNATWGERIARRLLELSRTDDEWQKGAAIWALGDLGMCPDLVVPRLIEAFDDYDEPDPDYCYGSAHTFVTRGLKAFGPLAVAAVPALLKRLKDEDGDLDKGVLGALEAIGPDAGSEAAEALRAIRA